MILDFLKLFLFTTEIETEIENKTEIKNSNESKAFSTFIITKKPPICWILAILIVYGINLPLSFMFLFLTYKVCCADIRHGLIFLQVLWITFLYQHLTTK